MDGSNSTCPKNSAAQDSGLADTSIAIHEMSNDCGMSAGDIIMAICIFAIQTIKTFARESLKERLLPELGDGKHIMSFALTEPTAGVNTLDIQTTAKKEGDGYVINGQKMWITLAHKASLMNVVARTTSKENAAKRTDGLTLFLVEKSKLKRGQIRTDRIDDISMRALGSNQVYLEDVFVPEENILGELDKGWEVLPTLLNAERISTASMSLGLGTAGPSKSHGIREKQSRSLVARSDKTRQSSFRSRGSKARSGRGLGGRPESRLGV